MKLGEHGVHGLFHISQTEALPQAEKPAADQPKEQPKAEPQVDQQIIADRAEISRLATKFRLSRNNQQPVA